jgi:hypothetical protein
LNTKRRISLRGSFVLVKGKAFETGGENFCWGPSASEGPQKHDLTMFLKYIDRYLRTRIRATVRRSTKNMKVGAEPKLCVEELRNSGGKGNRLKDEKPD